VTDNPATGDRRCTIYLHYDADDVLLYIGITEGVNLRAKRHAYESDWPQFAVRGEFVWCNGRVEAGRRERELIRELRPLFNRTYAGRDRDERIRAYLTAKDRLDLLAPPRPRKASPILRPGAPAPGATSDSGGPICGAVVFGFVCVAEPHEHRFHLRSDGVWVLPGRNWTGNVVAGEVR
jgi:hypothetical protein